MRMLSNVCWDTVIGVFLFAMYMVDNNAEVGINAKFIIIFSASLKLGLMVPGYIIVYRLCMMRKLNSAYYVSYINILTVLYAPWAIYCLVRFFDKDNDTKDKAGGLYLGMLYLMAEGMVILIVTACLALLLTCLSIFLCFIMRSSRSLERERLERNLQISNLISKIDVLHVTGRRFEQDELCCICLKNFEQDEEVIRLPCNKNHFFHKPCILDWMRISQTCPLCKTFITEEMLHEVEASRLLSDEKSESRNYGSFDRDEDAKVSYSNYADS